MLLQPLMLLVYLTDLIFMNSLKTLNLTHALIALEKIFI